MIIILAISVIVLAILFAIHLETAHGQEGIIIENNTPELKCLEFSDGTLAIVKVEYCDGFMETLGWLFKQNYHVESQIFGESTIDRMYLSR